MTGLACPMSVATEPTSAPPRGIVPLMQLMSHKSQVPWISKCIIDREKGNWFAEGKGEERRDIAMRLLLQNALPDNIKKNIKIFNI